MQLVVLNNRNLYVFYSLIIVKIDLSGAALLIQSKSY